MLAPRSAAHRPLVGPPTSRWPTGNVTTWRSKPATGAFTRPFLRRPPGLRAALDTGKFGPMTDLLADGVIPQLEGLLAAAVEARSPAAPARPGRRPRCAGGSRESGGAGDCTGTQSRCCERATAVLRRVIRRTRPLRRHRRRQDAAGEYRCRRGVSRRPPSSWPPLSRASHTPA